MQLVSIALLGSLGSVALTATAHAEQTQALPAGPVAGAWSISIGPVAEFIPGSVVGALGAVGGELDIGKRTSERLYVGFAGELSYVFGSPSLGGVSFSTDVPSRRVRAGAEMRYILSSWQAYVNEWGHARPPGSFWVGLRGGPENVDGTFGGFADLSFGGDVWIGHTSITGFVRAGVSIDPAGTYGTAAINDPNTSPQAPDSPGNVTPYTGMGIRVQFG